MDNKYLERFQVSPEQKVQYELLDTYFRDLQSLEMYDEEEWDTTTSNVLWRIVNDPDSRADRERDVGWVIGSRYASIADQDYEEFKQREFAVFFRTLIASGQIHSANLELWGTEELNKKKNLVANMKINLKSGGTILMSLANGYTEEDSENVRIRAYGANSPQRKNVMELDESKRKKLFPLRYILKHG